MDSHSLLNLSRMSDIIKWLLFIVSAFHVLCAANINYVSEPAFIISTSRSSDNTGACVAPNRVDSPAPGGKAFYVAALADAVSRATAEGNLRLVAGRSGIAAKSSCKDETGILTLFGSSRSFDYSIFGGDGNIQIC